jgi:hypothetical protein
MKDVKSNDSSEVLANLKKSTNKYNEIKSRQINLSFVTQFQISAQTCH